MPALIDRTGQIFGHILIVKELGHDRIIGRCLLCGKEKEYRKANVVYGKTTNCGEHGYKCVDMVGKTFGNILALEDLGSGHIKGRCLLCGNEKIFKKKYLLSDKAKSCGCLDKKIKNDCTGRTIYNILVLKELGHGKIWGRCLLCGREKEFFKRAVLTGNSKSCGCKKRFDPRRWNSGHKKLITENT